MSPYLLQIAVGPWEVADSGEQQTPDPGALRVRVATFPGMAKYAATVMQATSKVIAFLQKLFQTNYQFEKAGKIFSFWGIKYDFLIYIL